MPSPGPDHNVQNNGQNSAEVAQRRTLMLSSILTTEARERLSRIQLVKPEKAKQVEEICLHQLKSGRLRGSGAKLDEKVLIQILDSIEQQQQGQLESKVIISRRQDMDDEDLDLSQFDL